MKSLTIGIIENDLLIAESIVVTLQSIGYQTTQPVRNYVDALEMIRVETPDLLLIDIVLDSVEDGIDLAATVNKEYGIPFIFLTANSDTATVNRAKDVRPFGYIVKPFNGNDLFSSIEIAFSNYNRQNSAPPKAHGTDPAIEDFVFIKEGGLFRKVNISDILYIESDNVYLSIYTNKKHYVIRTKLDDFIADVTKAAFVRVHRSYAINLKHLEAIDALSVRVAGKEIPLHKNYRQELLKLVNTVK